MSTGEASGERTALRRADGGRSNVVELYVSCLRKKIDSGREPMIHTLRGAGYVLRQPT